MAVTSSQFYCLILSELFMRIIKEINLADGLKATVFSWNGKYLIKLERGALEQTYKVSELDVSGVEDIQIWLESSGFQEKIKSIFQLMEENLDGIW